MKLVEKIVSRATENTLLQIEIMRQISSILIIIFDLFALFLIFKSNMKILGLIILLVVLVLVICGFYLRYVALKGLIDFSD